MTDRKRIIVYLIIAGLFFAVIFCLYIRADYIEKHYQFAGIVQKINYGDKGIPIVTIKDKKYFVDFPNEDFKNKIKQGDSLIKEKNSRLYKLIKISTGKIIISE